MKKELNWLYFLDTVLNSYSQIFFSLNKLFASTILLVTFFDPKVGLFGLVSVLLVNLMAFAFGFNRKEIREGIFGFNALLFGLAMGFRFEINGAFLVLFFVSNLSLLVTTAVFKGSFGKVQLPFLSFPFLLSYWIVCLAVSSLSNIHLAAPVVYSEIGVPGVQSFFETLVHSLDTVSMPVLIKIFFKTLAATFFISSVLGGLLIAISLFLFSRITFSLAVFGFTAAFYVYDIFGADIYQLSDNMVGSNYIFFAIAIGGFYLIPNLYSYASSLVLVPVLLLMQIAFDKLFTGFELKTFTLAFSVLTCIFLYALHQRWMHKFLHLVTIQYYSAEKTVYKYLNALSRFNQAHLKKFALPFWGEWQVSQAYDGKITHLGDWSKALDFVVVDEKLKTYREPGLHLNDFYCYNKPVLAPADGYVYAIFNHIDDNEIGVVDTEKNWGNSILINHLDGVFSQISHLKKDSFKVAVGDFVQKGTLLAACGSSGRSPEPHMHFQLQTTPTLGAKTLAYPLAYYLELGITKEWELKQFEVPKQDVIISNVMQEKLLHDAFDWMPGKQFHFVIEGKSDLIEWEVFTDEYNRLYLFEPKTNSYAYFVNDGTRFYFTDFEGSRKSSLFQLYTSCYSVLLGVYPKINLGDKLPLIHFNPPILIWFQDVLAPFYLFTEARFSSKIRKVDQLLAPQRIEIESNVEARLLNQKFKSSTYSIVITEKGVSELTLLNGPKTEKWICVD
ncbi:MAG: hypothetical protein CFE21_06555 [Bacteroidetes bacterium B1(2017)]|nr:MAG: hypothetical protein CFE21_06555 [Bacteroidetes bacterium B1(2017)]